MTQFAFEAIGTLWKIDIDKELTADRQAVLLDLIMNRIDQFDRVYSRFRSDSLVTKMSQKAGTYQMPDDAIRLMEVYDRMYRLTEGAMTPLIGQVLSDAGYDSSYSLQPKVLSMPAPWSEAINFEFPNFSISKPVLLDFGAIGKGYLVDLLGELLNQNGVQGYFIDAGGDILCHRDVPTQIGLENPFQTDEVIGIAPIQNGSICGSSGNRRAWGEFHHIIDPRTLSSPRHLSAVWTFASTACIADALSTALFFTDAQTLKTVYDFEYVLMHADGTVTRSEFAPVELFLV